MLFAAYSVILNEYFRFNSASLQSKLTLTGCFVDFSVYYVSEILKQVA